MKFLKISIILLILAGGAVGVMVLRNGEASAEIERSAVTTGPLTFTVETLGTLEPLTDIVVSCEATGKIVEILRDYDDPVKKDEIICRIDTEFVDAQHAQSAAALAQAKAALTEAQIRKETQLALLPELTKTAAADLDRAKAIAENSEFNFDRIDKLRSTNNAVAAEWQAAKATRDEARAAVKAAEAAYAQAQINERLQPSVLESAIEQAEAARDLAKARFDATKAQVEKCTIRSPIDGIVLTRYLDVGTTVNPTLQPPPLFLIAPSLDRMKVSARVSESDIAHIEVGQKASFTVEGKQRQRFEGRILEKRSQPEVLQGVTTYTVILEVENDARRTLLPGMSVNVVIECVHRESVLKIANKALRFRPPLNSDERAAILDALTYPPEPKNPDGSPIDYCHEGSAWHYDEASKKWSAVPLWIGVTDNFETEIIKGAAAGDEFVDQFIEKKSSGFSFKEALRQADAGNRTL